MTDTSRGPTLLSWQWSLYPHGHRDRRNLLLHALTVPLFMAGTFALATSPLAGGLAIAWAALAGVAAMVAAMVLQGRGHSREETPPVRFDGPIDVLSRIFAEQWITFPRFVLSGGFARAWSRRSEAVLRDRS